MAALAGIRGQTFSDRLFDAGGTISSGGTAQLLLPVAITRSSLIIENISDTAMFLEFGSARATSSLTSGTVSSCSVTNAGIGFSRPPIVTFLGGLLSNRQSSPTYSLQGLPDWPSPQNPAQAHCVMTGAVGSQTVASIAIDNPGSGYAYPPYVLLTNDPLDPFGSAVPSATVGMELIAGGGSYTPNGSVCTTDQISIYCATTGKAFVCKYSL